MVHPRWGTIQVFPLKVGVVHQDQADQKTLFPSTSIFTGVVSHLRILVDRDIRCCDLVLAGLNFQRFNPSQ